jgi:DNA-directed RNA polymerase subunit RPC12/RpoP
MIETFTCPACGAPLEAPDQPATTLRCPYCGHQVIIPEDLRVRPEPVQEQLPAIEVNVIETVGRTVGEATVISSRVKRWLGCIVVAVIAVVIISALVPLLFIPLAIRQGSQMIEMVTTQQSVPGPVFIPNITQLSILTPVPEQVATPTPGFASLELSFGGQGTGAGLFEDARTIGVDGQGRIYVGEYQGGRVQVFDAEGKFITQWLVDPEFPLVDMAVARDGTVYIVQRGEVRMYTGASGKLIGTYPRELQDAEDIYLPLDGGLLAASVGFSDDILRFDRDGSLLLNIPEAVSGVTGDSELAMRVVEDGLGNLYALGGFNEAIYKYNSQGKFINQFGSSGDQVGQFRALEDLALDGQGRVYVSDIKGVQVFDVNGRYLDLIEVDGPAFGLVVDDQGYLYVAARTKVYKYRIDQ